MSTYQIVSRTMPLTSPPVRRRRYLSQRTVAVLRFIIGINIAALLFIVLLSLSHSDYAFILLPTLLSLLSGGSRRYSFSIILNSTLLYFVVTFCLSLVYYSFIAFGVLLTHPSSDTDHIILVCATLGWVVIIEPIHAYLQSLIEGRFNARDLAINRAVDTFTSTLREEIELSSLREHFLDLIHQTLKPYTMALWIEITEPSNGVQSDLPEISVADNDPFALYALLHPGVLEIDRLQLTSPLLQDLKTRSIVLALPLASQGEMIGLLILGVSLDGQDYTRQQLLLLNSLASQVAPAIRVAQVVREQQEQVLERERFEQELRTAQRIQRSFLPEKVPTPVGWRLMPYYQPAREVGGDFYDFIGFDDGRVALIIGDVSGKGVPAALLMATVHTMLRSASQNSTSPSQILTRVNELLVAEIPGGMFVTCFYGLLDPQNGRLLYANAGHEAPYRQRSEEASELWATGMPLGMLTGSIYDEHETILEPGERLFFYSDGLVEAHSPDREMFGFPRLQCLLADSAPETLLIDAALADLRRFTCEGWEQEDDVTLLELLRILEQLQ